ncbi:MAG: c-type cytochrome [Isosphaerales bacterium]
MPRAGSPQKKQRIAEIRGLLPEGDKGSAARGKPIFEENCAVCHRLLNEGETRGRQAVGGRAHARGSAGEADRAPDPRPVPLPSKSRSAVSRCGRPHQSAGSGETKEGGAQAADRRHCDAIGSWSGLRTLIDQWPRTRLSD